VWQAAARKSEIVILIGELTNQAARQRTQDIYDVIARPQCRGIRVLEEADCNWKRHEARRPHDELAGAPACVRRR